MTWLNGIDHRDRAEQQMIDAREAHEHCSVWLLEAESDVRTLGRSYERDCRVAALTQERRRLVACYMEGKRNA